MNDKLQERIRSSAALSALRDQLQSEIAFQTPTAVEFNPLLVLSLISVIIQIIKYCQEQHSDQEVRADIRDLRALPFRQQVRLRRALNRLWRENKPPHASADENPFIAAIYQLSDSADDAAIDELLALAADADKTV